jgi:hypothetical protein
VPVLECELGAIVRRSGCADRRRPRYGVLAAFHAFLGRRSAVVVIGVEPQAEGERRLERARGPVPLDERDLAVCVGIAGGGAACCGEELLRERVVAVAVVKVGRGERDPRRRPRPRCRGVAADALASSSNVSCMIVPSVFRSIESTVAVAVDVIPRAVNACPNPASAARSARSAGLGGAGSGGNFCTICPDAERR